MADKYILAIDEGTTGTRAVIIDRDSRIKAQAYKEFTQFTPTPDRTEHDPEEIWQATYDVMKKALAEASLKADDIQAIGSQTSVPPPRVGSKDRQARYNAIVWQDMRTAAFVESIRPQWGEKAYKHTGWASAAPFFSRAMVDHGERTRCPRWCRGGRLIFGNIDAGWSTS